MAISKIILPSIFLPKNEEEKEEKEGLQKKYKDLVSTFPQYLNTFPQFILRQHHGYFFPEEILPLIMATRDHFQAQPSDILLASYPKSGTTWLKALVFSIVRRERHSPVENKVQQHPLFSKNPHELVGSLETQVPADPDSPRIFHSHTPLCLLPESVKENAKIVYVCREPKDTIVSMFHFMGEVNEKTAKSVIEEMFTMYSDGICLGGPLWDHMLEFWNESKRSPDKVMFLKYDELKRDSVGCIGRLATFLGVPFSEEEEKEGIVEEIVKLCSFENLSNLDTNRSGTLTSDVYPVEKSLFFRLGKTGDWKNKISLEMAEKLDEVFQEKLKGSGLSF